MDPTLFDSLRLELRRGCLTLAVLAQQNDWLKPEVTETLKAALTSESASIKARSRILLKQLEPKRKR